MELNPDNSKTFPKSVIKTGSYGNGVQNTFSEPKFSLKGDSDEWVRFKRGFVRTYQNVPF